MEKHIPVLKEEVVSFLNLKQNGIYLDCTAGRGGHIQAILDVVPDATIVAIDKDPLNVEYLQQRFRNNNVRIFNTDYRFIKDVISFCDIETVDAILFDLGFSSIHVDDASRGFSFSKNGPLDMRYDTKQNLTAETVVNDYSQEELARIIKEYGEESFYKQIAKAIVEYRINKRIQSTDELRKIINSVVYYKGFSKKKIDKATKTFQAIRIEVNTELESLELALEKAVSSLNKKGRLAVISFHSIEDRIVKIKLNSYINGCTCPKGLVQCICDFKPSLNLVTKKPIIPSEKEIKLNPRSRSAKLRVAEKI